MSGRWLLGVVVLAGCGRVAFDSIDGDAGNDGSFAACAEPGEPNETPATATAVNLGDTIDATLCPGDIDVYAVELAAGEEVEALLERLGSGHAGIEIRSATETRAVRTWGGSAAAFAASAGTHYVVVIGAPAPAPISYRLAVKLRPGRRLFIATDGDDGAAGTFEQPWKTFDFALAQLVAGDVLVLHDGTYTQAANGRPAATCPTHASGNVGQPIRVAALSERRARILGQGDAAVEISGCSRWAIEGLSIENVDTMGAAFGNGVLVHQSAALIELRRLLVRRNNRYVNSALIDVSDSSDVLVEECELYDFHRIGVLAWQSARVTLRRNYAASRMTADIAGGYTSTVTDRGDNGLQVGLSTGSIVENNIDTGNGSLLVFGGFGLNVVDTDLLGNVSLENSFGVLSIVDSATAGDNRRTELVDHVSVDSTAGGYLMSSNEQFACTRCTALRSTGAGWHAQRSPSQPRVSSATCTDCLVVASTGTGFIVTDQLGGWTLDRPHTFGNAADYEPAGAPEILSPTSGDPMLGGCLVYAPPTSPLAASGTGARITHRYVDGAVTDVPLWDPLTGAFTCGAVVPGVNDDPATSCSGIHTRLHVGTADCPLPY